MTLSTLDLPIQRDNYADKRSKEIIYRGTMLVLAFVVDLPFYFVFRLDHVHIGTYLWLLIPVALASAAAAAIRLKGRDTLSIDKDGVHVVVDNRKRDYNWQEISTVKEVVIDRVKEMNITAVQIQLLGRIYGGRLDEACDYIKPGQFGLSHDDFIRLIKDGMQKWGAS